jgi:hypothetical protein
VCRDQGLAGALMPDTESASRTAGKEQTFAHHKRDRSAG